MDDKWFGDSEIGERFPAWTRGNAADVFPDPLSPLGQTLVMREGMAPGLRDAYIRIGALDFDEYENPHRPELWKLFGGYPYNPLSLTRVLGARMPGASPELIDQAFFDERAEVPPVRRAGLARVAEARGETRRVDGLGDVDRRASVPRRRQGTGGRAPRRVGRISPD